MAVFHPVKIRGICSSEDTIHRGKSQETAWEKILVLRATHGMHITNGLVSRTQ